MSVNVMCTRAWEGCHFLTSKNTQFLASSKVTRVSIKQVQFPYSQQLTYTVHLTLGTSPPHLSVTRANVLLKLNIFNSRD